MVRMTEEVTFDSRMKRGLVRIDAEKAGTCDAEALAPLRRSLERTLTRREPGSTAVASVFRFQMSGSKALLFQGTQAVPLEPDRLYRLLHSMDVILQSGESIDLDGGLAEWLIRPEVNMTDTKLRQAEESLRGLRMGRERDHSATQTADSLRIRLRSRLTQLVGALQAAHTDTAPAPGV